MFLKRIDHESLPDEVTTEFQRQFERLVVLDYIIRNTGKKILLFRLIIRLVDSIDNGYSKPM